MKQMVAIVLSVVLLCTNIPVIADTYDEEEYYFLQEEDFSCVQSCLIDEHLYYRFDNEVEWDEARAFCESVGGHLMTIDNGMEETAVKKMLGSESYMMEAYWLGAKTDANSGAGYKWIGNETGTDLLDYKVEKGLAVNNESSIGEMGEKMLLRMNGEQAEGSRLKIGFICEWDDGNNISRYGSTESNEGEFSFLATQSTENKESKDITGYYFFEDAYFEQDAREYNPSLATMSLCLALSAFNSAKGTAYGNVKKLLEENQFYNIHVNDGYLNKPGQDTIGVAIAKRNDERISMWELQSEEEETEPYTLLAVAIRGGGYGKEWCSNVKMGTSGEHQGFEKREM